MTRFSYPHTIENGHGESLTFIRHVPGPKGDRLEIENRVSPGSGPPMHVHHLQEEALTVREGRMAYQHLGQPPQFAGPGETVVFPAGDVHRFWNAGKGMMHCTGYIEPADNIEYFLSEIYASQVRQKGPRPDPFDAAYLSRRYRSEFAMAEVPALVQRLLFPVLVGLGTLLGRFGRFADAPEPVRR